MFGMACRFAITIPIVPKRSAMHDPNQVHVDTFIALMILLIALAFAAVPTLVQFFMQ